MEKLRLGENINAVVQDGILTITIDTSRELRTSKSGKSTIVATTGGNQKIDTPNGRISVGINAYKPRKF